MNLTKNNSKQTPINQNNDKPNVNESFCNHDNPLKVNRG